MRSFLLSFALLLTACSKPPVLASASGESRDGDSLTCAMGESTARGYVVVDAAEGVFFRAEQPKRGKRGGLYHDTSDVLTGSVARGVLTVQATAMKRSADGDLTVRPSRAATADTDTIIAACTG